MGTPAKNVRREITPFSPTEMQNLLSLAEAASINYDSRGFRIKVLEGLRIALLPMAQWLDQPVTDFGGKFQPADKKTRAMPFVGDHGKGVPTIALCRNGNWLHLGWEELGSRKATEMTSEELADFIVKHGERFRSVRWNAEQKIADSIFASVPELKKAMPLLYLMKFTEFGIRNLQKIMAEREARLRILWNRTCFLESGLWSRLDPLTHMKPRGWLPSYSMYHRHEHGVANASPTYFEKGPVAKLVAERNTGEPAGKTPYSVHESEREIRSMEDLLFALETTVFESMGGRSREGLSATEAEKVREILRLIKGDVETGGMK